MPRTSLLHLYCFQSQKFMDSLLLATSSLCGFFALLCIWYIVRKRTPSSKLKEAPQPAGAWPIIGHLHLLAGGDLPYITLGTMADKYGPAFVMQLGVHQAMVVSDPEIAKECFTTNDKVFATRPSGVGPKIMAYNYAMLGFAQHGPYWHKLRKISMLELLSNHRLESLKHVWNSEIAMSSKELHQFWTNQTKDQGPVSVDMKQWFGDITLNVSVRLVAGKRYFGASAACTSESMLCRRAVRDFSRLVGLFVVSDFLPFLGWLDLQGYEKEMKSTAKELDSILQGWLDEHKRKRQSGETVADQDFTDVMLSNLESSNVYDHDADTVNKATCFTMIFGGSDTTMATLTWALSLVLNNPDVLKKAQDELGIQVSKDRHVDESDIKNLVYLQAIVKETFRLYPAAPLLAPHEAMDDCMIGGYHVPAGTRLIVNAWKIHRDPSAWSNPCEFQPERFLNKDVDVKGQHFELIPFGSGRRACPGISLALQVVSLILARVLHEFEFRIPSEGNVDMTESIGLINTKATPLEVLITPLLSPKLYA